MAPAWASLFQVSVGAVFEGWNYIHKGNYIVGTAHGIVGTSDIDADFLDIDPELSDIVPDGGGFGTPKQATATLNTS